MPRHLAQQPRIYRLRPDLGRGVRACVHGRYLTLFEVAAHKVRIIHVRHGAREATFPRLKLSAA